MNGFNLVFFDENGKEYRAKSITRSDYILLDPETGAKFPISRWAITQKMKLRPGKENNKAKSKTRIKWGKMIFKILLALLLASCASKIVTPPEEKTPEVQSTNIGLFKSVSNLEWMLELERVANCVKQKQELYQEIESTEFTRNNGKSSREIASELRSSSIVLDVYSKWAPWSKEIATHSKAKNAALFRVQSNPRPMQEMVETAFHEPMHNLGYFHNGNYNTEENRKTVPYKVGEIASKHLEGCL